MKKKIEQKLAEIAYFLQKEYKASYHLGFLEGKSGIAYFFLAYYQYSKDETYKDLGYSILEEGIEQIEKGYKLHAFCAGIAGYGWTLELLAQQKMIEVDLDEILEEIDDYLKVEMLLDFKDGYYDYLHGGGGVLLYFLQRLQGKSSRNNKYIKYIEEAIDILFSQRVKDEMGTRWVSLIDHKEYKLGYNISLSHGTSSICVILNKLIEAGIRVEECKVVLKDSVKYIMNQLQDVEKYGSYFPTYSLEIHEPDRSRLGWCYGDIGIANTLRISGKTIGDNRIVSFAQEIINKTLFERQDITKELMRDAGVCHGTSGLALYAMLEKNEKNKISDIDTIVDHWIKLTLEMSKFEDGYAGYKVWAKTENSNWVCKVNSLEGITGIGLVFLSYLNLKNDEKLEWAESLILM